MQCQNKGTLIKLYLTYQFKIWPLIYFKNSKRSIETLNFRSKKVPVTEIFLNIDLKGVKVIIITF